MKCIAIVAKCIAKPKSLLCNDRLVMNVLMKAINYAIIKIVRKVSVY
jgi:hypothetical protein